MKFFIDQGTEKLVLGTIMVFPGEVKSSMLGRLSPDLFKGQGHADIAYAIIELYKQDHSPDVLTVKQQLSKDKRLERIGGSIYLTDLCDKATTSASLEYHVGILEDLKARRAAQRGAYTIIEMLEEGKSDLPTIHGAIESLSETVAKKQNAGYSYVSDLVETNKKKIREAYKNEMDGISSGFHFMDRRLRGLKPEYHILAGRPGNGKSTFAMNMMMRQASKGIRPGFISLEMGDESIAQAMISASLRQPFYDKPQEFSDEQWIKQLNKAMAEVCMLPIMIDDTQYRFVEDVSLSAYHMRYALDNPIDILYVDYAQLLDPKEGYRSKPENLSSVSRELNSLKKRLGIPIIALAQINREIKNRQGHEPILTDLKGSGSFEEDADVVMFTHDPTQWADTTSGTHKILIAKNRNGPTFMGNNCFKFRWDKNARLFDPVVEDDRYDNS